MEVVEGGSNAQPPSHALLLPLTKSQPTVTAFHLPTPQEKLLASLSPQLCS